VVRCFTPALGGGDGYIQVFLDPVLPNEVIEVSGTQVGIK